MGYRVYCRGELLCDTRAENLAYTMLDDAVLDREANQPGSFEGSVPLENNLYGRIQEGDVIRIERGGRWIWDGFVTDTQQKFDRTETITCEGALSYLKDQGERFVYNDGYKPYVWDFWQSHCGVTGKGYKDISPVISGEYSGIMPQFTTGISFGTAWEGYNIFMDTFGGYAELTAAHDLVYHDGVSGFATTKQEIRYGENLKDLQIRRKMNDIVTRVRAFGMATKGWWIFKKTDYLDTVVVNSAAEAKFGVIERFIGVEGTASTIDSLERAAREELAKYRKDVEYELEVKALDLYDLGMAEDPLDFLKRTRIVSEPHGFDRVMLCTQMSEPLYHPENKTFVYGEASPSLSVLEGRSLGTANRGLRTAVSAGNALSGTYVEPKPETGAQ